MRTTLKWAARWPKRASSNHNSGCISQSPSVLASKARLAYATDKRAFRYRELQPVVQSATTACKPVRNHSQLHHLSIWAAGPREVFHENHQGKWYCCHLWALYTRYIIKFQSSNSYHQPASCLLLLGAPFHQSIRIAMTQSTFLAVLQTAIIWRG